MMLDRLATDTRILQGDVIEQLRSLKKGSVDCVITSPPYWRLRDYGMTGQLGLEKTPREYIRNMVKVFRAVRRTMKDTGTLWMNMGDAHVTSKVHQRGFPLKAKMMMPHRLAIALQDDGWYMRQDIVWHKQQPQPETVSDRPTTSHEYLFLLSKSARYEYDAGAIAEQCSEKTELRSTAANSLRPREERDVPMAPKMRMTVPGGWSQGDNKPRTAVDHSRTMRMRGVKNNESFAIGTLGSVTTRNKRSVWPCFTDRMDLKLCTACMRVFSSNEFGVLDIKGALVDGVRRTTITCECGRSDAWYSHYAAFGAKWIEPAVLAGCPPGGTILDCFAGTCTTLGVAVAHGRKGIGIELNPYSIALAPKRMEQVMRRLKNAPAPERVHASQSQLF